MKMPSANVWRGIACGGMIAVALAFALPVTFGGADFESRYADNQATITQLEEQIKDLENADSPDAAKMNQDLHSAADTGLKVAEYQTKYQTIDATVTPDAVTENAEALSEYFTDDAQNGRSPWFTPSKGDAKVDWEFKSTYSFNGTKVPVIWLCTIDGSDELVAYATATFDAETGKFSDVETNTTANASAYVDATVENENSSHIDELIKSIQDKADDVEGSESDNGSGTSDEATAQDQSDARAWLKQQSEDGGDE